MIAATILYLYPNAVPVRDFIVQDDGKGPYLAFWNDALGPRPSEESLTTVAKDAERASAQACVRDEYLRRLVKLLGARDLAHVGFIRADDVEETATLSAIAQRTQEQEDRLKELSDRKTKVEALIDRYNVIDEMNPIPDDVTADALW